MKIFILDPPLPLEKVILVDSHAQGCPKMDGVKERPRVDKIKAVINVKTQSGRYSSQSYYSQAGEIEIGFILDKVIVMKGGVQAFVKPIAPH